jgi:putative ABC transport system permease protein
MPNVAASGASLNPPFSGAFVGDFVVSPPGTPTPPDAEHISRLDTITPGWLATYGITIETGRDFDDHDTLSSPRVMIVNKAFVHRLLPERAPLGTTRAVTLRWPPYGEVPYGVMTIVGVVGDTVFRSLRDSFQPAMYVPLTQFGPSTPYTDLFLVAKSTPGSPEFLQRDIASTIANITHDVTFSSHTLAQEIEDSLAEDRVTALLSGLFGALALLLASVGLYGTTAHTVCQRRGEIGIRIALGATEWNIIAVFVRRALLHGITGTTLGLGLAYTISRVISSLVYGVTSHDLRSYLGAAMLLLGIVVLASYLPARRATKVDPLVAFRCE